MKNVIKFIIFIICCLAISPIEIFVLSKTIGIEGVSFLKLIGSMIVFSFVAKLIYVFIFSRVLSDMFDKDSVKTYMAILCCVSYLIGFIAMAKITNEIGWVSAIIQGILLAVPNCAVIIPDLERIEGEDAYKSKYENKTKRVTATTFRYGKNLSTTEYRDEDGNRTVVDHWNIK